MMTGPLLLSAAVGASVSFLGVLLFNSLRISRGHQSNSTQRGRSEEEFWE
jgi:hypothetical protein